MFDQVFDAGELEDGRSAYIEHDSDGFEGGVFEVAGGFVVRISED